MHAPEAELQPRSDTGRKRLRTVRANRRSAIRARSNIRNAKRVVRKTRTLDTGAKALPTGTAWGERIGVGWIEGRGTGRACLRTDSQNLSTRLGRARATAIRERNSGASSLILACTPTLFIVTRSHHFITIHSHLHPVFSTISLFGLIECEKGTIDRSHLRSIAPGESSVDLADFRNPPLPLPVLEVQNIVERPMEVVCDERDFFVDGFWGVDGKPPFDQFPSCSSGWRLASLMSR